MSGPVVNPKSKTQNRPRRPRIEHAPALVLAAALATGMVLDHYRSVPLSTWQIVGFAAALLAIFSDRFDVFRTAESSGMSVLQRMSCGFLLIAVAAVGGARHHLFWSLRRGDNIRQFAHAPGGPARLRGVLTTSISIRKAEHSPRIPEWMQIDHSIVTLQCERINDGGRWQPVSGRVRLDVEGHLVHVRPGERVEVVGRLARPFPPRNPGDFDYDNWLRSQGLDAVLRCEHPQAVRFVEELSDGHWRLMRWRSRLRKESEQVLVEHLSDATRPVALSMLLGDRSEMTEELRDRFTESGTMHLLAISGLHVGMLLGMVFLVCRLLNLGRPATAAVLMGTALGYAALTDQQPSVLRATILAALALLGSIKAVPRSGFNTLGLCGAMLLLWSPAALFDIGAQLSFLAVGAIIWANRTVSRSLRSGWGVRTVPLERPTVLRMVDRPARWLGSFYVLSGAVWLATVPLTMWRFHLLAPVGLVINVVLIPYTAIVLGLGFTVLWTGMLLPAATPWPARAFDASLQALLWLVHKGSDWGLGHVYLPSISGWWVIGFYVFLLLAWGLVRIERLDAWRWRFLGGWLILGLAVGLMPGRREGLRCTFLAVGHGLATVIELPDGRTILYDAGTFGDGRRAAQIVEQSLWDRGIGRIDAIMISHADVDHFNGVATLLETLPVGTVFCHRSFLDFRQEGVAEVCEAASRRGVPIRLVQAGDRLGAVGKGKRGGRQGTDMEGGVSGTRSGDADDGVTIEIVHPGAAFHGRQDNANSVVLLVRYQGESILLTGDLEGEGWEQLSHVASGPLSVLASPHHGGRLANPQELYDWAGAEYVIASTGTVDVRDRLEALAGPQTTVFSTATDGAVVVTVTPQRGLEVAPSVQEK